MYGTPSSWSRALLARRIVRCAWPIQSDALSQGGKTVYSKGGGPSIGPWTIISIEYLGMGHGRGRRSSDYDLAQSTTSH